MGYSDVGEDKDKAVRLVLDGIRKLKADVGIPTNLKEASDRGKACVRARAYAGRRGEPSLNPGLTRSGGIDPLPLPPPAPFPSVQMGVKLEDVPTLAENAMKDACGFTNPIAPTKPQVEKMFIDAYNQQ